MAFFSLKQNWWKNKDDATSANSTSSLHESNFDQVRQTEKAYETVKRGIATIPLDKIKGSVGRYTDFDQQFRLEGAGNEERLASLTKAMQEGRSIPPISLYQIKDNYYVVDGHHRVRAARNLKQSHIQAKILELLPSGETVENRLYLEKINFRDKVGIPKLIDFTEPGQSEYLFEQINKHQQFLAEEKQADVSLKEAGKDWYRSIYLPLRTLIKNSGLLRSFPDRTMDDLYLYISTHQWQKETKRQYGIGVDKLIPRDMETFRKKMANKKIAEYPEMKRDITIFILINVDGTQEQRLLDKLFALPEVVELHSVHGSIDLVVKAILTRDLLTSDAEVISQFTQSSLRCMKGILSTQTLIPGLSLVKPQA
ncbi:MAG TPA: transcriptional regulator [Desulfobacterales bacterium]|nr:transcriptional regulator [Desulfobacterales bacterium]HIP38022.1 transcriptional regulator [Desulfocapsa sulfexigens]